MGDAQSLYIIGRIRHLAYFILLSKKVSVVPALKLESRESVVGIVNCCGLQVWGSKSGGGQEIFSSPHPFRPAVVPTQPIQSVPGPFAEDQAAGEVL